MARFRLAWFGRDIITPAGWVCCSDLLPPRSGPCQGPVQVADTSKGRPTPDGEEGWTGVAFCPRHAALAVRDGLATWTVR